MYNYIWVCTLTDDLGLYMWDVAEALDAVVISNTSCTYPATFNAYAIDCNTNSDVPLCDLTPTSATGSGIPENDPCTLIECDITKIVVPASESSEVIATDCTIDLDTSYLNHRRSEHIAPTQSESVVTGSPRSDTSNPIRQVRVATVNFILHLVVLSSWFVDLYLAGLRHFANFVS